MERGKRIDVEFRLPEVIIQQIQSFLTGKEAAQTSVLSKSWYNAWLTRPKVDFNEDDFRECNYGTSSIENRFWKVVNKTVERYEKLNLKIDSLRLWIYGFGCESHPGYYSLVNELIMKVLKMGVTCLDFKIYYGHRAFTYPHQVFELENLISLSVSGCNIELGAGGKVGCSRLKSLTLVRVNVEGEIIWDIIRSCPLIENLSLSLCCTVSGQYYSKLGNGGTDVDGPFNKLKCLFLSRIDVHTLFFHDLSSKFPCLKDLSVHDCCGNKEIKIFSPSLECISFRHNKTLRVKFVVPSIRKFTFSGPIPSLSFKTTTRNWESDISISCHRPPSASWILNLNKLLTKLSLSKVSLTIQMYSTKRFDCAQDIKGLPKPEVENLKIDGFRFDYTNYPDLLGALFRCCRPIYVTRPDYGMRTSDFMEFVYKRVKQEVSSKCCSTSQSMSGESDLEEVDVEIFDEAVSAWRPQLLDASTSLEAGASNWESEISVTHYYCPSSTWFPCARRDFEEINVDSFDEAISARGQFSVSCVNKAKRDKHLGGGCGVFTLVRDGFENKNALPTVLLENIHVTGNGDVVKSVDVAETISESKEMVLSEKTPLDQGY